MKIVRNILGHDIEIELTEEERQQAYREQQVEYYWEDIESLLDDIPEEVDPMPMREDSDGTIASNTLDMLASDRQELVITAAKTLENWWDKDEEKNEKYWNCRIEALNKAWLNLREKRLSVFAEAMADHISDKHREIDISLENIWAPGYSIGVEINGLPVKLSLKSEENETVADEDTVVCPIYDWVGLTKGIMDLTKRAWKKSWQA